MLKTTCAKFRPTKLLTSLGKRFSLKKILDVGMLKKKHRNKAEVKAHPIRLSILRTVFVLPKCLCDVSMLHVHACMHTYTSLADNFPFILRLLGSIKKAEQLDSHVTVGGQAIQDRIDVSVHLRSAFLQVSLKLLTKRHNRRVRLSPFLFLQVG